MEDEKDIYDEISEGAVLFLVIYQTFTLALVSAGVANNKERLGGYLMI